MADQAGSGRGQGGRWSRGTSGNPTGRPKQRTDAAPPGSAYDRATARVDGWYSAITGLGLPSRDKRMSSRFAAEVLAYEDLVERYRGSDLAARIIETQPTEEIRQGFDLAITGQDHSKELQEIVSGRWEDLGLSSALWEARSYERAYGGAAILLGVNDGAASLAEPLSIDRVRSLDWLTVLEARELIPQAYYTNPQEAKFGRVAVYLLNPSGPGTSIGGDVAPMNVPVHESRLLVFPGIRVTRRPLSNVQHGWGDSVLVRCEPVLRDFNMSWDAAGILVHDFAQAVFKFKGLAELIGQGKDEQVKNRMLAVELSRSVARAILIDAEEDFKREQTPLAGLPELLDRFSTRLAAAADMPVTLLMGQSPAGLNATGESDVRFFYDRVRASQERKLRPAIERVVKILFKLIGKEPESWSIRFAPLWQPTDVEQATARFTQAQADQIYLMHSVLDPDEVARSRFGGDEYSFTTQIDFAERERLAPTGPIQIGGKPDTAPPKRLAPAPGDDDKGATE